MAIPLPPSITVNRSEKAEAAMVAKARAWIEKDGPREGIHASDLLNPRKGFWRHTKPLPPTDRDVGFFLVGRILHAFVLHDQGPIDLDKTDEGSTHDTDLDLYYSPDKLHDDFVEEFKTSRSYYEPRELKDIQTYLEQLLIYMAMKRMTRGRVSVFYLNARDAAGKTTPTFRVYNVSVPVEELDALRLELRTQRNALADALASGVHTALPLCPEWMCHPEQCPYWDDCKPEGRHGRQAYLDSKRR